MSLRETQKSTRRAAILDAAARLYLERGFDAVRAEEIAKAADSSTATIYNYFGGKGDILMTLVTREAEAILAANAALVADPPDSAMQAFQGYFAAWFDPSAILLDRALWRQGVALSFTETDSDAARRFRDIDRELAQQAAALAQVLQDRGALRGNVVPDAFAAALTNNVNMLFFDYTRSEDMTLDALRETVEATVGAVVSIAEPGRVARG